MKCSPLTNVSRPSRGPAAALRSSTGDLVTNRLNGDEYQRDVCCSFHSPLLSLFHTHARTHAARLCRPGQSAAMI